MKKIVTLLLILLVIIGCGKEEKKSFNDNKNQTFKEETTIETAHNDSIVWKIAEDDDGIDRTNGEYYERLQMIESGELPESGIVEIPTNSVDRRQESNENIYKNRDGIALNHNFKFVDSNGKTSSTKASYGFSVLVELDEKEIFLNQPDDSEVVELRGYFAIKNDEEGLYQPINFALYFSPYTLYYELYFYPEEFDGIAAIDFVSPTDIMSIEDEDKLVEELYKMGVKAVMDDDIDACNRFLDRLEKELFRMYRPKKIK